MDEDVLRWPTMGGTYLEVIGCLGAALVGLLGRVMDFNTADGFGMVLETGLILAMFTLYRIGFCSVSKVAPVQCEQELMFCCGAEIVPKRSQCEQKPYPLCNLQRSLLI